MALNLSTRELRAFVSLAEQRSFTRAASRSAVSQPAISALIRGLEETLGVRLFHRTTRHVGYAKSLHARPRIEPAFGWLKTIAWLRKVKLRGLAKVDWLVVFASAAFNVLRLPKLLPSVA